MSTLLGAAGCGSATTATPQSPSNPLSVLPTTRSASASSGVILGSDTYQHGKGTSDPHSYSYAIYEYPLSTQVPLRLTITAFGSGWLLVANYSTGRWETIGEFTLENVIHTFDLPAAHDLYAPQGAFYFCIIKGKQSLNVVQSEILTGRDITLQRFAVIEEAQIIHKALNRGRCGDIAKFKDETLPNFYPKELADCNDVGQSRFIAMDSIEDTYSMIATYPMINGSGLILRSREGVITESVSELVPRMALCVELAKYAAAAQEQYFLEWGEYGSYSDLTVRSYLGWDWEDGDHGCEVLSGVNYAGMEEYELWVTCPEGSVKIHETGVLTFY